MTFSRADWSLLTTWLLDCGRNQVTISWEDLGAIVGGLPESATKHYPQWWSGDRPISRAWLRAGYEKYSLDPVARTLTLNRSTNQGTLERTAVRKRTTMKMAPKVQSLMNLGLVKSLESIDPKKTLIILPCSGSKATGGGAPSPTAELVWSPALQAARLRMRDTANVNERAVMPAWRRYTGGFYQAVGSTLANAIKGGAHVVILSGGYGLVHSEENIGDYERALNPADWPSGVLQAALLDEAIRIGAKNVVAFAATSTGYAKILRRTQWNRAGIEQAVLVTAQGIGKGAMRKVPRNLGLAFVAFWNGESDTYPSSIVVEKLN